MNSPAVDIKICLAFLRRYLSGFQGCPRSEAGENRFAEALQSNAVSVEHLEAVLQSFDEEFPTVRQIHDISAGMRPKFEPQTDQHAEWERQYGKPNAFAYPSDRVSLHWQALRDMLFYTEGPGQYELAGLGSKHERAHDAEFWGDYRHRNLETHADSVAFIRHMIEAHGWPGVRKMDSPPEPMPYTSPNARHRPARHFANVGAPITQADIQRAESERRKSTK